MENNDEIRPIKEAAEPIPKKILEFLRQFDQDPGRKEIQQLAFSALIKIIKGDDRETFRTLLADTLRYLEERFGIQSAYNLLQRLEAALGLRKPTLGMYDHTFHIIGGGEKYGLTAANALQEDFDITIIANKEISHKNILDWYHLDLSRCKIKVIHIPFFEELGTDHLDPARISKRMENPFHLISRESGNYDFFINNGMNEMVFPLANVSAMIVHFPERRPLSYFYADRYTYTIYNSQYTAGWIEKKWKFSPHRHIFPPVDMESAVKETAKENIIISAARFEVGGSKKQLDMARTFIKLKRQAADYLKGWKLILAGGSHGDNPYLEKVQDFLKANENHDIELRTNIPGDELKALYQKAKIFWHLCGLDQTDPALVEHFGMTIVEAMQNKTVPIVFDGGGQREIVEQGKSGFRVTSTSELIKYTLRLIQDPSLWKEVGSQAYQRSKLFTRERFAENVKNFFGQALREYTSV